MTETDLEAWWEESEPHQDVRSGQLSEEVFEIDLGDVLNQDAPPIYQDPIEFYNKTHVTQVLENLIRSVVENTSGNLTGNRIQRLQTGFGGGKTHLLLSLYHLLTSPDESVSVEKIQAIIDETSVDSIPDVNVGVLVGTDLSAQDIRTVDGTVIQTLWGELAYQLGGMEAYDIVATDDRGRTSPGKEKLAEVLRTTGPNVILIDEFLQYVSKARAVDAGETTLGDQSVSFIDEFVRAVGTVESSYAVLSLQASERYEMYADPEADEQLLSQIESKVQRVDEVQRPVQKSEIYNIARQRIFDDVASEDIRRDVADAYFEYYKANSSDFPDQALQPGYRERLIDSYPFHPELVTTLYDQWASLPDFQRTRGVLRFLAKVVGNQYHERTDAPLIHLGHVDMADEPVRDEALDYLEEGWDSVIGSDIAGDDSKSAQIDRQLGGVYNTYRVTQSVSASVFMYSHGGGQQVGAPLERIRLGVLQPGMNTPLIRDALGRCEDSFFYLYERDGFYRFRKQPNLNQVVSDYESEVEKEDKLWEIRNTFPEVLGESCFKTHIWGPDQEGVNNNGPDWDIEPSDVPDDHTPRLAILPPDKPLDAGATDTMAHVREMWEDHKDEFREFRNSIVFIAADAASTADLYQAATTKIALREIKNNQNLLDDFTDEQIDQLEQRSDAASSNLPTTIRDVYSEAVVPTGGENSLKRLSLGPNILTSDDGIDELLQAEMESKDMLLLQIDPNLIASDHWGIWPVVEDGVGDDNKAPHLLTSELWDYFGTQTQLPMLKSEKVLRECIARGVDEQGVFGYAKYSEEGYEGLLFRETCNTADIEICEGTVVVQASVAYSLQQEQESETEETDDEGECEDEEEPTSGIAGQDGEEITGGLGQFGGSEDEGETGESGETHGGIEGVSKVTVNAQPSWEDQWDDAYDAIIAPLARLGADIELEINVDASSEDGMDKSDIERQVKENLTQRNIEFTISYEDE